MCIHSNLQEGLSKLKKPHQQQKSQRKKKNPNQQTKQKYHVYFFSGLDPVHRPPGPKAQVGAIHSNGNHFALCISKQHNSIHMAYLN